jgi:dihydrofolate reductase
MQKVVVSITMSVDGFSAGPNISKDSPLGKEGESLHDWMFVNKTEADTILMTELVDSMGAVIVGSRTYVTAIEEAWSGVTPFKIPAFVVCHEIPQTVAPGFTFVTDGIESALAKAREVAGNKNIWVMGGANIIQQYLNAKLVDILQIHIASFFFVKGTRLFEHIDLAKTELRKTGVIDTPGAVHITYEILR